MQYEHEAEDGAGLKPLSSLCLEVQVHHALCTCRYCPTLFALGKGADCEI